MKLFSIVLVTLTFTPLVWSAEDTPASHEVNISKLKELLSSSTESLEKEQDASQVVSDNERVLPAESNPELDPAENEEDTSKDRAKKSYSPAESPYPAEAFPATHHVSHVHSYVAKPAYGGAQAFAPPGPTFASSHITYSAQHPPPQFPPSFVHVPPYCIEIRPKIPTQAPFFVCEPPYKGVVSSPGSSYPVQQHPSYGRADEHQTQSPPERKHQTTTTSPPPPATTSGQTTKAVTEKPKEESGSHGQPAPSPGGSPARTAYYPPSHGSIYPPNMVPHPSPPVKSPPFDGYVPHYPPAHSPAYPAPHLPAYPIPHLPTYPITHLPAYPAPHPPAYTPVYHPPPPLILNCHAEPSYAAPPANPIAMLQLFMRPAPGYSYSSYREPTQEDEKKEKTSPKKTEASPTPVPTHLPNKGRDQQGGMMAIPHMRQSSKEFAPWSMRADLDQEPTSIGIPLPNGDKMSGDEIEEDDCGESSPKMAEAGKVKVPVGSKGKETKETNKSPVNSRMNFYMPGQSMALSPFK